ncbi:hypothetical protein H4I67_27455 (plasmid) [Klebsiella pneumoniae]|nr:hypothetical protein H4I67_27455 [Klebsiella pneumoniae]
MNAVLSVQGSAVSEKTKPSLCPAFSIKRKP